jgi:methyltransferase-like protein/cyclopropane fatty-acyl-phospholipid synthase-like methyltransferase
MADGQAQSYDEVPYPSLAIRRTHPSHLAALARLFGLSAKPPGCSRVLELGCAAGGNLLPMAIDFPGSQFLGIDASARQIADGQAVVDALGLENIELRHLDILAIPDDLEPFDYVLCHGVFSWVPRPVQDQILQISRRLLAPHGVVYISYNTYPGWYLRAVVRDMMRYHVRNFQDPHEKIGQARALLDFLVKSAGGRTEAYRQVLRDEAEILRQRADAYLFHEHLEETNQGLYLHEFLERAEEVGLQYLADTEFSAMLPSVFGPEVASLLDQAPLVVQEQYLDFLRNRSFRGTLLCPASLELQRQIDSLRLAGCDISLETHLDMPGAVPAAGEPLVCHAGEDTIRTSHPGTQAAMICLNEIWPETLSFDELCRSTTQRLAAGVLRASDEDDSWRRTLAQDLMALYSRRLLRVLVDAPRCTTRISGFPMVTPLARWQASQGQSTANRRHESLRLTEPSRHVVPHLDGRHDWDALKAILGQAVEQGALEVSRDGQRLDQVEPETLHQILDHTLRWLAENALLVG